MYEVLRKYDVFHTYEIQCMTHYIHIKHNLHRSITVVWGITFLPLMPCSKSVRPVSFIRSHSGFCKTFFSALIIVVAVVSALAPVLSSVSQRFLMTMWSFSPLASCDATKLSATSSREHRTWNVTHICTWWKWFIISCWGVVELNHCHQMARWSVQCFAIHNNENIVKITKSTFTILPNK